MFPLVRSTCCTTEPREEKKESSPITKKMGKNGGERALALAFSFGWKAIAKFNAKLKKS